MLSVYLISATDHAGVKRRRHPTVCSCASSPHPCSGRAGDVHMQAINTAAATGRDITASQWHGLVLFEYSKFRMESNSYFSIRFDSKRAQLFEIFEYLLSPIGKNTGCRLHFSITGYRFISLSMRAPMRSMYLISAADHTSVKRCRRPC